VRAQSTKPLDPKILAALKKAAAEYDELVAGGDADQSAARAKFTAAGQLVADIRRTYPEYLTIFVKEFLGVGKTRAYDFLALIPGEAKKTKTLEDQRAEANARAQLSRDRKAKRLADAKATADRLAAAEAKVKELEDNSVRHGKSEPEAVTPEASAAARMAENEADEANAAPDDTDLLPDTPPKTKPKPLTPEDISDGALAAFKAASQEHCPKMLDADLNKAGIFFNQKEWMPRSSKKKRAA
jgi:hypothetical protein